MQRCFGCMREFEGQNFCPYCGYKVGTGAQEAVHMVPGMLLHRRYTVGRVLGYGSFGVTYIAWDPILQQPVAVKEFMPSEFSTRIPGYSQITVFEGDKAEQFRDGMRKFVEEARHLAKFGDEPGIVKIFDSFEENGTAYIVMEYLEGETLAARLEREGVIPEDEAVKMLRPIMESLSIVHQEGLLHRDIAPDNIFLTKSGEVKLIDFGASRYATTSHSRSLTVIIKPGYSPEEQYRSRGDQGPYTDVYAVAATLYRMITGVVPPDALERRAQYENANRDILKEPHKVKKGISLQRENAILNAMNVRIEDRTPDMETFMRELEADPPAKRIYGKIKKLDFYRLPLWLKIALPAVLGLVLLFGTLMLTGVISFKRTQREFYVPEGIVMVPEVEGLNSAEATALIKDGRLLPVLDGNVESEYITAGKIVLQTPAPGAFSPVNSSVKVIVSAGKGVIPPFNGIATVPYVILDSLEDARTKLQKAGLGEVSVEEIYDESVKEGLVISQDIESGTEVEEGSSIKLEVSKGPAPFVLGNYIDQTYEDAKKALEDLGLQVTVDYKNDNEKPEGTVLAQDIDPETQVRRGDSIVLTVSSGKETLTVEDVVGQAEADAKKRLEAQGFEVNILENFDKKVPKGLVISQTPAGGSSQLYGSQITIIVSKGKQPIKVSFDTDGGEAIAEALTVYEGEAYGTLPTPSRDGYTFEGWYLSAEGEERITEDSLVQGSSDHNLVARWEVIETTEAPTEPPTTPAPTTTAPPTTPAPTQPPTTAYVPPTTPYVPPTTPAPTQPPTTAYVPPTIPAPTQPPTTAYVPPTTPAPTQPPTTAYVPPTTPYVPPTTPAPTQPPTTAYVPPTTPAPTTTVPPTTAAPALPNVGDIITFGSYPQDGDGTVRPIEWQVLAVENGKALLISLYALDAKPYNTEYVDVTWETCTLRSWLNNDFYNTAFSASEQSKIALSWILNQDNPIYGTPGGNNTQDKVFLLSLEETLRYLGLTKNSGQYSDYVYCYGDQAMCWGTDYALSRGAAHFKRSIVWWLRSPGNYGDLAAYVTGGGGLTHGNGNGVSHNYVCVRPALWFTPNP